MEGETDLRDMIVVALRWWWLIVAPPLVLALIVWYADRRQPPDYQALALVAVTGAETPPSDASAQQTGGLTVEPDYPAYSLLASSDGVLEDLLGELETPPAGVQTVADLRSLLWSGFGASHSTVKLVAHSDDPQVATRIANDWADALVERANALYRPFSSEESRRVGQQVQEAQGRLAETEQALAESEIQGRADILRAQLASAKQELKEALADKRRIERAIGNAKALRSRISKQPHDAPALAADQLTALLLQAQTWDAGDGDIAAGDGPASDDATPDRVTANEVPAVRMLGEDSLQVQVGWPDASGHVLEQTAGELMASVDQLAAAFEAQTSEVDAHMAAAEQRIVALQEQAWELDAQAYRLTTDRDLARETYLQLARRLEGMRAGGEDRAVEARVASYASVAEGVPKPTIHRFVSAGAVGLMAGILGAFGMEWWRRAPLHTRLDHGKAGSAWCH